MKKFLPLLFLLPAVSFVVGCSANFAPEISEEPSTVVQGVGLTGTTYGGQSPIYGAQIYLLEATTNGYGAISKSLISDFTCSVSNGTSCIPSNIPGVNGFYFVQTNSLGYFYLQAGQYSCDLGAQVYLVSYSGKPGLPSNPTNTAAGEMAALGTCVSTGSGLSLVPANSNIYTNEVSTVAAAYAFSGFWGADEFHLGSANTSLSKTGIINAANNAANLYSISGSSTGAARSTTIAGNGTVPAAEIDSIANSLANCVNSTGPTSGGCATLLGDAKSGGTTGTTPTDTSQVAINIAHNPSTNITAIYNNAGSSLAFGSPILAAAPNDFTIAINYTHTSLKNPAGIAIDAAGNAWIADNNYPGVTKLSPTGALSAVGSGSEYGFFSPYGIAIDNSGNAWVADEGGSLIELNSSAIPISGTTVNPDTGFLGFSNDASNAPTGVAIDISGNIWVSQQSNVVNEFTGSGADETGDAGFPATGMTVSYGVAADTTGNVFVTNGATRGSAFKFSSSGTVSYAAGTKGYGYTLNQKTPTSIALDPSSNVWMTNDGSNSVTKFTDAGASVSDYTTGFSAPSGIAFDGSGNAWITNATSNALTEMSNSGSVLSGSIGFTGAAGTTPTSSLNTPTGIAIDPSGNVWVTDDVSGQTIVTEFIGAATPVVTPIVASLLSPYLAPASKP